MEAVVDAVFFSIANPFRPLVRGAKGFFLHIHDHFIPHPRNNYYPHILGKRSLALSSLLLLSVKVSTIVLLTAGPVLPAYSSAITADNIFSLTNDSRDGFGLPALTYNDALARAAQSKADALLACGCFQHNLPDGRTPWDFIKAEKYNYIVAGENLAVDFTQAENVETAWMNSPGHRANILNKNFEQIGVAMSQGLFQGHQAIFVVQMFGTQLAQAVKPLNQPTHVVQGQAATPPEVTKIPVAKAAESPKVVAENPKPSPVPAEAPVVVAQAPAQVPQPTAVVPAQNLEPLAVLDGSVDLQDNQARVSVKARGDVVKVLANYGGDAVMLEPRSDGTWQGSIDLNKLINVSKTVSVLAFDMSGKTAGKVLAGFSPDTTSNYNSLPQTKPDTVSILGWQVDPKLIEYRFYLLFATTLLTCLVLAIAVRKHVQHISLIANTSFVAAFAILLWVSS